MSFDTCVMRGYAVLLLSTTYVTKTEVFGTSVLSHDGSWDSRGHDHGKGGAGVAPSSCRLEGDRAGRPRTAPARSSGHRSNPADLGPRLERPRPCGAVLAGGEVAAAEMEEVVDLVVGGEEPLCLPR